MVFDGRLVANVGVLAAIVESAVSPALPTRWVCPDRA
jgi:hypothetical protein